MNDPGTGLPVAGTPGWTASSTRMLHRTRLPLKSPGCYTFPALQQPEPVTYRPDPTRRAALRLPLVQGAVGAIGAGVLAVVAGGVPAVAFLVGAVVIATGFAMFGWRTSGRPPVAPAGRMFVRLLVGTALKWLVIGAGLVLAMNGAGLPAEFVLGGALSAFLASMIGLPWLLR
ncbi:MAG: hypothetical protein NVV60_14725 [Luteimonas sp.]|nr:hypothetical protein [Luteimonas sp.]